MCNCLIFFRTMYDDVGVLISNKLDFDDKIILTNQLSCSEIYRALDGVRYIAECTKREEDSNKVIYFIYNKTPFMSVHIYIYIF